MNIKHIQTVIRHRNLVMKYCFKVGIPFRGLVHDLSKFSPDELIPGIMHYEDGKRSPIERAREVEGYSTALMHHRGRNKHHFEYWYDINKNSHTYVPVPMPLTYLKESFCDRIAASRIYKGDDYRDSTPYDYMTKRSYEESLMHPCTSCILRKWLKMLAEVGEEETLKYIRSIGEIKYCPKMCPRVIKFNRERGIK